MVEGVGCVVGDDSRQLGDGVQSFDQAEGLGHMYTDLWRVGRAGGGR